MKNKQEPQNRAAPGFTQKGKTSTFDVQLTQTGFFLRTLRLSHERPARARHLPGGATHSPTELSSLHLLHQLGAHFPGTSRRLEKSQRESKGAAQTLQMEPVPGGLSSSGWDSLIASDATLARRGAAVGRPSSHPQQNRTFPAGRAQSLPDRAQCPLSQTQPHPTRESILSTPSAHHRSRRRPSPPHWRRPCAPSSSSSLASVAPLRGS